MLVAVQGRQDITPGGKQRNLMLGCSLLDIITVLVKPKTKLPHRSQDSGTIRARAASVIILGVHDMIDQNDKATLD